MDAEATREFAAMLDALLRILIDRGLTTAEEFEREKARSLAAIDQVSAEASTLPSVTVGDLVFDLEVDEDGELKPKLRPPRRKRRRGST